LGERTEQLPTLGVPLNGNEKMQVQDLFAIVGVGAFSGILVGVLGLQWQVGKIEKHLKKLVELNGANALPNNEVQRTPSAPLT
jgi:hypothetical protein